MTKNEFKSVNVDKIGQVSQGIEPCVEEWFIPILISLPFPGSCSSEVSVCICEPSNDELWIPKVIKKATNIKSEKAQVLHMRKHDLK